jgi:phosphoglycolate phosphatase
MKNSHIILSFDLDNTLINNREGIVNSFKYALKKYNLPELNRGDIEKTIGIPLFEVFQKISDLDPNELIIAFREYYTRKGIYQGKLLPHIKDKLEELSELGFTLGIITSKKQELAQRITEILGISKYFDYIIGETEEIKSKVDPNLKNHLLKIYPNYQFIIIGDHPKDKALAQNLGVPFIGVLTGNHSAEELSQKKAITGVKIKILYNVSEINLNIIYDLLK